MKKSEKASEKTKSDQAEEEQNPSIPSFNQQSPAEQCEEIMVESDECK